MRFINKIKGYKGPDAHPGNACPSLPTSKEQENWMNAATKIRNRLDGTEQGTLVIEFHGGKL